MSIVFWKFSLFVNIKYFHNISDNKLNQAFLIDFFYTEKLAHGVLWKFQPIFNQIQPTFNGLVVGLWPTWIIPLTFMNICAIVFEISCMATDKQTNKRWWKHSLLAEVIERSFPTYFNIIFFYLFPVFGYPNSKCVI